MTLTGVATPDGVSLLSKLKQPWYLICSFDVANAFSFATIQREQKYHVVFTWQRQQYFYFPASGKHNKIFLFYATICLAETLAASTFHTTGPWSSSEWQQAIRTWRVEELRDWSALVKYTCVTELRTQSYENTGACHLNKIPEDTGVWWNIPPNVKENLLPLVCVPLERDKKCGWPPKAAHSVFEYTALTYLQGKIKSFQLWVAPRTTEVSPDDPGYGGVSFTLDL